MSNPRKRPSRLGRGLSSLMATPNEVKPPVAPLEPDRGPGSTANQADAPTPPDTDQHTADRPVTTGDHLEYLPVKMIQRNPHQPREQFKPEAIRSLAASIRERGVIQPILVRPTAPNDSTKIDGASSFQIVAGERRWRAAREAGLDQIPAIVRQLSDEQCAEWALIENLQREDLNSIEKAQAFKQLADQFGLTQAQIAERMGLERSTVSNHLRLLDLSDLVLDLVKRDLLSMGQARAIAGLPEPTQQQKLAERAVREQLSVRKVEEEVRRLLNPPMPAKPMARDNHFADLDKQIGDQLGTKVRVKPGRKKGTGTLSIDFYSLDQFEAILSKMQVSLE